MAKTKAPLWRCPNCQQQFTTANSWHSCGAFNLEDLFGRSDPLVRQLYDLFVAAVESCCPVIIIPQKSRIAFQVRMRFAALMPQRCALKGHLILAARHESACFERIDTFSPRSHLHAFRLANASQLNQEFHHWLREAYQVGAQEHLAIRRLSAD